MAVTLSKCLSGASCGLGRLNTDGCSRCRTMYVLLHAIFFMGWKAYNGCKWRMEKQLQRVGWSASKEGFSTFPQPLISNSLFIYIIFIGVFFGHLPAVLRTLMCTRVTINVYSCYMLLGFYQNINVYSCYMSPQGFLQIKAYSCYISHHRDF